MVDLLDRLKRSVFEPWPEILLCALRQETSFSVPLST